MIEPLVFRCLKFTLGFIDALSLQHTEHENLCQREFLGVARTYIAWREKAKLIFTLDLISAGSFAAEAL